MNFTAACETVQVLDVNELPVDSLDEQGMGCAMLGSATVTRAFMGSIVLSQPVQVISAISIQLGKNCIACIAALW